jgi:hypothetical protein
VSTPSHEAFRAETKAAGYDVEEYNVRFGDDRPAVRVEGRMDLQQVIRATTVVVDWDTLGTGWIVYPLLRALREDPS